MDGWVTIGTKLDSRQLEKDLRNSEKRLQQYEKEAEKLTKAKTKAEIDLQPYEEQKKIIQEMTDEANRYAQTRQEVENNLTAEKLQLESLNKTYSNQLNNLDSINQKILSNANNQELMKNQIEETRKKMNGLDLDFKKVGNSVNGVVKKIGRWVLAVFSIRSAYMTVRSAMSTLSQTNDELANKLEMIRLVFASALEPVVTRLVDLVYKLLSYVNYIAKAWFNVDLFASASEKAMKKSAGSAEKMRKSLAGFDEMNVISDTSTSGGGATADFPTPENVPIPEWIKWIADNKDIVLGVLVGIGVALASWKIAELVAQFGLFDSVIRPIFEFIGANATTIGGLIAIFGGLALVVDGVIKYFKDPTWENFIEILGGIAIASTGVALIFGGIPAIITAIIGVIGALGLAIYKNWDDIVRFTKNLTDKIKSAFSTAINWIKDKFNSMVTFFNNLVSKIVGVFKTIGTKVGDVVGSAFKTVVNGVLKAIESILNTPIKAINSLVDVINKVPGINLGALPTFNLPRLAKGTIVSNPGRGVLTPSGNALYGEAGREAYLPLSDTQLLEELGSTIGRHITINANITNTMNGRVISRELKTINANNNFAGNN